MTWEEIVAKWPLEDDDATVFDSPTAYSLECYRCWDGYVPPTGSERAKALGELVLNDLWWSVFRKSARQRCLYQRDPHEVSPREGARRLSDAVSTATGSAGHARDLFEPVRDVSEMTAYYRSLERHLWSLDEDLTAAERALTSARKRASWVSARVARDPDLKDRALHPRQLEYGWGYAGFARLVFLNALSDQSLVPRLAAPGMSRYWTLVGYAIRLKPVPRSRRERRGQQALWRRTVSREYERLLLRRASR